VTPLSVSERINGNGYVLRAHRRALAAAVEIELVAARLHGDVDDLEAVCRQLGRSWSRLGRALADAKRERARDQIRVIEKGHA